MFGLLTPCRHTLGDDLAEQWRAHLCGLCLSLRDGHGQASRLTTNTDAVMVSVLVAAQCHSAPASRMAGPCPMRAMSRARVIENDDPGIRLAASASLTLAAGKALDTAAEQTAGLAPHAPGRRILARHLGERLRRTAINRTNSSTSALDVDAVLAELGGQAEIESRSADLDELTQASGAAASRVFASAADLAEAPQNRETLAAMGQDFGRIAHLVDAIDDLDRDRERGDFNPLIASGTTADDALADCRRLARAIRRRYTDLDLVDDRLLRVVLLDGLTAALSRRRTHRIDCAAVASGHSARVRTPEWPPQRPADWPRTAPYPPPFRPNRRFHERVVPFTGVSFCGPACFREHWNHCSDQWKDPLCDSQCSDCCDCCDCCD